MLRMSWKEKAFPIQACVAFDIQKGITECPKRQWDTRSIKFHGVPKTPGHFLVRDKPLVFYLYLYLQCVSLKMFFRRGLELIKPGVKLSDIAAELNDLAASLGLLKYR